MMLGSFAHRLSRRPLRPALHLPVQPADVRPRLAGGGVRAQHDGPDRLPLRDGRRPGRRKRRRLFDHDRIRAGAIARQMARSAWRSASSPACRWRCWWPRSSCPQFGWRAMFVLGGIGALIVWYLRKALPESPRWLEAVGRTEEAEALMQAIEREAAQGQPLPAPAAPPDGRRVPRSGDAVHPAVAVADDRRLGLPDHHQHAALRFRHLAAGVLHQAGPERSRPRSAIRC